MYAELTHRQIATHKRETREALESIFDAYPNGLTEGQALFMAPDPLGEPNGDHTGTPAYLADRTQRHSFRRAVLFRMLDAGDLFVAGYRSGHEVYRLA